MAVEKRGATDLRPRAADRVATCGGRNTRAPVEAYIASIRPVDHYIVVENTQRAIAQAAPYIVEFRRPRAPR
jgi:hypothetical protein